jgi:predicted phosphodiesterase
MKIGVLPDVQARPGDDFTFLSHVGAYFAEKKPDVIVCLGDFADMESLSSYDIGKKSFEGRRYSKDIKAAREAMHALMTPLIIEKEETGYDPRLEMLGGNHDFDRIERATEEDSKLDGLVSIDDLGYEEFGWNNNPFLEVVTIGGVAFSHYLVSGVMGRPITTSAALLSKRHMSTVVGHQQGLQISTAIRADGAMLTGIIAGSCYEHKEKYLGPQGNKHFRGLLMLHDVRNGEFEPMPVTLKYLKQKRYAN